MVLEEEVSQPTTVITSSAIAAARSTRITISPHLYAETVIAGSQDHEEARQLQAERFARVSMRESHEASPDAGYVAVTEYPSHFSIPIVVKQTCGHQRSNGTSPHPPKIVGTARLDLPGGMLIESMIRLAPGSVSEQALAHGKVGEISTFATSPEVDKATVLDIIDGIVGVVACLAEELRLDWLWIFPRNGFMSILLATIPGVLPGYQFQLDRDVMGWNEDSGRLRQFRSLHLRGVSEFPEIYQISAPELKANFTARCKLRPERELYRERMDRTLLHAMWQARREMAMTERDFHGAGESSTPPAEASHLAASPDGKVTSGSAEETFLPFSPSAESDARYLRAVLHQGGQNAAEYKLRSYDLLDLHAGMTVLDVGCGVGVDLQPLQARVGTNGSVIGLDHSAELVRKAKEAPAVRDHSNVMVFQGDAHSMSFPAGTFDRVRADRTLQHCWQPEQVIAEMYRVLRPGGVMTAIEPDWKGMVIYPAGAHGGDDDRALSRLQEWYADHIAHALIGRQLRSLLAEHHETRWSDFQVEAISYSFSTWESVDTVLQAANAATSLGEEDPPWRTEMLEWLRVVESASHRGEFFAVVPLFFAYAAKASISA